MIRVNDLNPNTIPQMLCNRATYTPNDVAYCFPERKQAFTWAQMWREVRRLSEGLIRLGIKKGDRIAILMEGRVELIQSLFAAATVGAVAIPLNTYSKKEELKKYLLDAQPALFILGTAAQHLHYSELVDDAISSKDVWLPRQIFVQGSEDTLPLPFRPFSQLMDEANSLQDEDFLKTCRATHANEPAFLLYTSGTTGFPKGVIRSTASFLVASSKNQNSFGYKIKTAITRISDRYTSRFSMMALLPLYHLGGIGILFTSLKSCNVRTVMLTHYNPIHALNIAEQEKCKFLIGTPFMIQCMLASQPLCEHKLSSLLGVVFTSAAVNSRMIEKIIKELKSLYFFTVSYGSSEAGAVANGTCFLNNKGSMMVSLFLKILRSINLLNGEVKYEAFSQTPYSIGGKVDKNVELRVIDLKTGNFLPDGVQGEIVIRSHRVMPYTHDSMIEESFLRDGWYKSGDIGFLDDHGHLIISGRIKRLISRGGEKISPVEIENALLKNPSVADAFVVGIPDEMYGEQICAALVEKEGTRVSIPHLKEELSSNLSHFKVPKYFVSFPSFPLSSSGKISSEEIKKLAMQKISEA